MNQLKHFAFPVPPYSTSPHPDSPGCGRVVQYTHPIGEADDGDRVGIERAVMLHTNLKGQLSAAIDKLHKAREEFNAWAGKGNGPTSSTSVVTWPRLPARCWICSRRWGTDHAARLLRDPHRAR